MTNTCKVCGKSFEAKQARQKVCGTACRMIASREYGRIYQRSYRPKAEPKTCRVCGKQFSMRGNWKVCSVACQVAEDKQRTKAACRKPKSPVKTKPEKPAQIPLSFTRACLECQKEFMPDNRQQRTCSDTCRKVHAKRLNAEYRKAHGIKPSGRIRTEPIHTAGGVSDDPRTDARAARIAGLAGYYEANTLILMRRTGLKRAAAVSLPCRKADNILKGIRQ